MLYQRLQRRVFIGVAFKKTPAKGIDEEQYHAFVARGQALKDIAGQCAIAHSGQEVSDAGGDIGEAIRVIEWPHKIPRESCSIHRADGNRIEHSYSYPATASHALSNSATLHACAKQPAGANGVSGSATSQIEPTQSSQRCFIMGC